MFGEIGLKARKKERSSWASVSLKCRPGAFVPPPPRTEARFFSTQLPSRIPCNSLKTQGACHGYPSQNRGVLFPVCGSRS
jgi:hypothetical protein